MPAKPLKLAIILLLVSTSSLSYAQGLFRRNNIRLPADSTNAYRVMDALTMFLVQKDKPNKDNQYVWKDELLATSDLLDEIKGMDGAKDAKGYNAYKCYLTNLVELSPDNFIVQISYTDLDKRVGDLRASFRLMAKRIDDKFIFYSPLKRNTAGWKIKKFGNLTCHYKDSLNVAAVKSYQSTVGLYNKKLKLPDSPIEFYYCDNFPEAQQIVGIDYKQDYNGVKNNSLSSEENGVSLEINGGYSDKFRFDAHDLWHARLRMVMDRAIINRPVDEGCAYLYGGSWGYTWDELLAKFKTYVANNPNADWINLYTTSVKFADDDKPMYVAYVLNALIVKKIEREQGFAPVMDLLGCGNRQNGDENYFAALKKITGIDKADFNAKMWELVKTAK
jgi:hypothetical protein